jgi:very-short-patch-repair endonuclease
MGKMGYKVLRIPTWVLVNKPEDVIKAILEFKPKEKIKKSKTKKVIKLKRENKT